MKRITRFSIAFLVISLMLVTAVSAHGPGDDDHRDRRDRHHGGFTPPMAGPGGFDGEFGNMEITGEVSVTEDDILIEFTVTPDNEHIQEMRDRHGRGDMDHMPDNLTNGISVSIPALVEYIDIDNNGYTSNDTVLSTYGLNESTLNDPVINTGENGTTYTIESVDGIFVMYLYLNENDGIPHSWKWSIELNSYPFLSDQSAIAMVHSVESNGKHPIGPHHDQMHDNGHQGDHGPPEGMIHDNRIRDDHERLPAFFKWDTTALVDDVEVNVTASLVNDSIAISIPQGEDIFYDPEVGIEADSVKDANNFLSTAFQSLEDVINSPTSLGLILGAFLIISVPVVNKFKS